MRNCQEHLFPLFIKASVSTYLADEGYTMNNRRTANLQKNRLLEIIEKIKKTQRIS